MKLFKPKYQEAEQHETALTDPQLERALLVAILSHVNATGYVVALRGVVMDEDFSDEEHANVWRWCKACAEAGQEVNLVNVYAQAQKQGKQLNVRRYVQARGSEGDIITLADALHTMGVKCRMSNGIEDVLMSIKYDDSYNPNDAIADVEKLLNDTTKAVKPKVSGWRKVYNNILKMTERKARGEMAIGTPCGFTLIDRKGGMERGELMIIAGRNSNGKTSFALCCAVGVAQRGTPVGIFSLEMTNAQLGTRIASLLTGVNGESIKRADMTQQEWDALTRLDDALPIYFDEVRSPNITEIIGNIKAMVAQKGVQVVVIDYLQLLSSRERERVQQVGAIAHSLETLSKQLEITIILISQLRRNVDKDPTPRMEELKESGDIADAADSIYLVYRPERHGAQWRYPDMSENWSAIDPRGTALLMCCKNRNGAMEAEQMLGFDATTTRFYERNDWEQAQPVTGAQEYETPF